MNSIIIECSDLVNECGLSVAIIKEQLNDLPVGDEVKNFVLGYKENSRFTLIGEIHPYGKVILTNIIKAIDFHQVDNRDLF